MKSTAVSLSASVQPVEEVINRAGALSRVDGDSELMASLVDIFLSEASPMMEAVRDAVASRDPGKLEKAAHRLKGSVSIFSADAVTQTTLGLETKGRAGDLTHVAETLAQLEHEMVSLLAALKQFHRELHPAQ